MAPAGAVPDPGRFLAAWASAAFAAFDLGMIDARNARTRGMRETTMRTSATDARAMRMLTPVRAERMERTGSMFSKKGPGFFLKTFPAISKEIKYVLGIGLSMHNDEISLSCYHFSAENFADDY
jgi:hypothetical protein